jgi:hypothetical protein
MKNFASTITTIFLLGVFSSAGFSQTTDCPICGHYSTGITVLKLNPDHTFEFRTNWHEEWWKPSTCGSWRANGNIVFLTTEIRPSIMWANEAIEEQDTVTLSFSDKNNTTITRCLRGILRIVVNGTPQEFEMEFGGLNLRAVKLDDVIHERMVIRLLSGPSRPRPIDSIEVHVDGIVSFCKVRNQLSNSFQFVLDASSSDLCLGRSISSHFWKEAPLFFSNDTCYMQVQVPLGSGEVEELELVRRR